MKIAIIADTHGHPFSIPECDVFVHAGDMTRSGQRNETRKTIAWMESQTQAGTILIVPGNHDECLESAGFRSSLTLSRGRILVDEVVEMEGVRFYGSPWTPPFYDWAFMMPENRLQLAFSLMPDSVDVLITHGPPKGILDPGHDGSHAGSEALLEAVNSRYITHHVFGHLHDAGGQSMEFDGTHFHNVAACSNAYKLVREAKIIEL